MQISREFISLGGKQKTPKPAFSRPRSPKLPAPRLPPRPRRCPCSPGGALHSPLLLSLQSVAVFANTDIAVHVQRLTNSYCGDAVRQGPGGLLCGRQAASRHWRTPGLTGARGGSAQRGEGSHAR
ncbi:uncharacterized protein WM294_004881 isoform 1-T2 [Sarcoramphus papa]